MPENGKQAARAIVRAAQEDLSSQLPHPDYPEPGEPWDGVAPGQWAPDHSGLPPKCPIYPLGFNGEYLYVIDTKGQLRSANPNNFGKGVLQSWLWDHQEYAAWAWPRSADEKKRASNLRPSEFNVDWARSCFYKACGRRKHWDPTHNVRGRGAWSGDDGELIYHCGDRVYVDGKPQLPGEIGSFFYPARPALPRPWPDPVPDEDNPARKILAALQTWSFTRPDVDPYLILGWLGSALLAGALEARPTLVLVGDAGVGKTTMQKVMAAVMGEALVPVVNATGAGIWQKINMDSLAVAIDEFENDPKSGKGQQLLDLARQSVYGGVMLRGGADHKGMEFKAQSSFMFGAINIPPLSNADRSRMLIVDMRKLDADKIAAAEPLNVDDMGPKMLRQLMDGWPRFPRLRQAYGEALVAGGHADRGQDVFATLLTCAHLLLGDAGVEEAGFDIEHLEEWGERLARDRLQIVDDSDENWRSCLTWLLSANVDLWRQSTKFRSVGAVLQNWDEKRGEDGGVQLDTARALLEETGLGLKVDHRLSAKPILYVPRRDDKVNKLFEGSKWQGQDVAGVWDSALRQGPPDIICTEKEHNRIRIDGRQQRCVLVKLDEFWQLENAEVQNGS